MEMWGNEESNHKLDEDLEQARWQISELKATLSAIQRGEVDAVVIDGPDGLRLFSLHSAEEPYRVLAERMNEGAAALTAEGTILFCNKKLAEMVDAPAHQLLGTNFRFILSSAEREGFMRSVSGALREGKHTQSSWLEGGHNRMPVQLSLSSIPLEGDKQGICLIATDISEQKSLENKLQEKALLVERAQDAIMVREFTGKISFWNRGASLLYGWSADEALGQNAIKLLHTDFPEPMDVMLECLRTNHEWEGVVRQTTREGQVVHVASRCSLLLEGEHKGSILVVNRDITASTLASASLRSSEARYRSLVNASAQIVWATDNSGQVTTPLLAWESFTGQETEKQFGTGWISVLHPDDREKALKAWQAAVSTRSVYEVEYRLRRHDGQYRTMSTRGAPVLDEHGEIREWIGTCTDITDARDLEEQLRKAQKMEAIGRLSAGIAHDFNNDLAAILGFTELLQGKFAADTATLERLAQIERAAHRAATLTRQLLAFSRQQVLQPVVLNLNATITDLNKMLPRLLGTDVEVILDLATDLASIKADSVQVEQILLNLAINARDAMPNGGRLIIQSANVELDEQYAKVHLTCRPGAYVMLAVSDNGTGMDELTQSRIFEPFFTTKEAGKGTGLGLSTVYGIVKQSGGFIWVYSELGIGTTFKLYFPAVSATAEAHPRIARKEPRAGNGELIVLVDDTSAILHVMCELLQSHNYHVLPFSSPALALQSLQENRAVPAMLITDLVMPGMNGRELAKRVQGVNPQVRVLYMSGYTDDTSLRLGVAGGADSFLQKPFNRIDLLRKVRWALDSIAENDVSPT
jgi:PAS domain S-box-containing protein